MAYVDKHLLTGERVIYRSRQHWVVFTGPALLFVAALIPLVYSRSNTMLAVGSVIGVAALLWAVARTIARLSAQFTVTNKRVVIKLGTIQRRAIEMLLSKIEEIAVDQGVGGRLLGYGTVVIVGTGGSEEIFMLIADPLEFRRQVQEQIEQHDASIRGGGHRPRDEETLS